MKSASVTGRKMTAQEESLLLSSTAETAKKKQYKCDECGMTGHTRKTCQFCIAMNRYHLQHLFDNFFLSVFLCISTQKIFLSYIPLVTPGGLPGVCPGGGTGHSNLGGVDV